MGEKPSSWEELDCLHLADDERGDRLSLHLGGAAGGVALAKNLRAGLIAAAAEGTLFITNLERLGFAAQRVLSRIIETGRYTPVGDPFPRPIGCQLIVGSFRPLAEMAQRLTVCWSLAEALGAISLSAEEVVRALEERSGFRVHPGSLAAAS